MHPEIPPSDTPAIDWLLAQTDALALISQADDYPGNGYMTDAEADAMMEYLTREEDQP